MKTIWLLLLLSIALVPFSLAQGTYTQIDVPGAIQTTAAGINNAGDIVGYYVDSNVKFHGYLLTGGVFTTIDYPGAGSTYAYGINDLGQIVGAADNFGFLYDLNTTSFTKLTFTNPNDFVAAYGINNSGAITGVIQDNEAPSIHDVGFELVNRTYHVVRIKGFPGSQLAQINNLGEAAGLAYNFGSLKTVVFLFNAGKLRRLRIRSAQTITGINDAGTIVGTFRKQDTTTGFVYQYGLLQSLIFPGSPTATAPSSINNSGVVVGSFVDAASGYHGFTWTPPSDVAKH